MGSVKDLAVLKSPTPFESGIGNIRDFLFRLFRGFKVPSQEMLTQPGRSLYATSVVADLFKDE
jgi:hypothetical protein